MPSIEITHCENCDETVNKNDLKRIIDYLGKSVLVCKDCHNFIKSEREQEQYFNQISSGIVIKEKK